jgi:hypothetical protein
VHPHQLHALATAHSLTQARQHLAEAVAQEIAQQRRDALVTAAAANIQAWRPVIGRSAGGHSDPVGLAVLGGADAAVRPIRPGRLGRLASRVDDTLHWLAHSLGLVTAIVAAVPELEPAGAREVWLWLGEADQRIRRALLLDPAEQLVAGAECPACRMRLVHVQTAAPERPLVCRAPECRCRGEACGCGMSAQVEGLVHIWPADRSAGDSVPAKA